MKSKATARLNFVEPHEVLLQSVRCDDGHHCISESRPFGRQYRSADLVVDDINDPTVLVMRFNWLSMSAEDVTEEIAEAFLKAFDAREDVTLDDEKRFPEYVKGSMVWRRWKDDLEAELPVVRGPDPDFVHDQHRESALLAAE